MAQIKMVQVTFQRHGCPEVETRVFINQIPNSFNLNTSLCLITEFFVEQDKE